MKFLACFVLVYLLSFGALAKDIGPDFQPSPSLTFLADNVTLGSSDGTWCTLKVTSPNNSVGGMGGTYLFAQVNKHGVMKQAPLVGGVQVYNIYKLMLLGDHLIVEIRDSATGKVLCPVSGNDKKATVTGTWVWPTKTPYEGLNFCAPQTPAPGQHIETATLEVACK